MIKKIIIIFLLSAICSQANWDGFPLEESTTNMVVWEQVFDTYHPISQLVAAVNERCDIVGLSKLELVHSNANAVGCITNPVYITTTNVWGLFEAEGYANQTFLSRSDLTAIDWKIAELYDQGWVCLDEMTNGNYDVWFDKSCVVTDWYNSTYVAEATNSHTHDIRQGRTYINNTDYTMYIYDYTNGLVDTIPPEGSFANTNYCGCNGGEDATSFLSKWTNETVNIARIYSNPCGTLVATLDPGGIYSNPEGGKIYILYTIKNAYTNEIPHWSYLPESATAGTESHVWNCWQWFDTWTDTNNVVYTNWVIDEIGTNWYVNAPTIEITDNVHDWRYWCNPDDVYEARWSDIVPAYTAWTYAGEGATNGSNSVINSTYPDDFPIETFAGMCDRKNIGIGRNLTTNCRDFVTNGVGYFAKMPESTNRWLLAELHSYSRIDKGYGAINFAGLLSGTYVPGFDNYGNACYVNEDGYFLMYSDFWDPYPYAIYRDDHYSPDDQNADGYASTNWEYNANGETYATNIYTNIWLFADYSSFDKQYYDTNTFPVIIYSANTNTYPTNNPAPSATLTITGSILIRSNQTIQVTNEIVNLVATGTQALTFPWYDVTNIACENGASNYPDVTFAIMWTNSITLHGDWPYYLNMKDMDERYVAINALQYTRKDAEWVLPYRRMDDWDPPSPCTNTFSPKNEWWWTASDTEFLSSWDNLESWAETRGWWGEVNDGGPYIYSAEEIDYSAYDGKYTWIVVARANIISAILSGISTNTSHIGQFYCIANNPDKANYTFNSFTNNVREDRYTFWDETTNTHSDHLLSSPIGQTNLPSWPDNPTDENPLSGHGWAARGDQKGLIKWEFEFNTNSL